MASYWLLKTEPGEYSYADLERDRTAEWDGVSNPTAQRNMRMMAVGDVCVVYHTGDERQAVGLAEVTSAPYPDPKLGDPKLVVVDVKALRPLAQPITLAAIKADPAFTDFALVRQGRLSVVPVTEEQWRKLIGMTGESMVEDGR